MRSAYEAFLDTGELPTAIDPVVAASWRRSRSSGVDPEVPRARFGFAADELHDYRVGHPLARFMPVVRELLVDAATDDGLVVAVSDDLGRLLWVEGSHRTRGKVDRVGFVEGAQWREELVGTNAPGTALATGHPVQVHGAEHFSRPVQALSCTAAPIRDQEGRSLGSLDVTGGPSAVSKMALSLVRATAATIERDLRASPHGLLLPAPDGPELSVLSTPTMRRSGQDQRLSLRHAEILILLAEHPPGLTAEELAVVLHPDELSDVTVRAEISRLRRALGPLLSGSRPYQVSPELRTDVAAVRELLASGDVRAAVARYAGPVLPRSVAPGVEQLRAELDAEMRSAVLSCGDIAALDFWTRTGAGGGDHAAWTELAARTDPGTPLHARARAHVAVLDSDLS